MSKKCFLSAWEILGLAHSLAGFCHLALSCRSCKCHEIFRSQRICCKFLHRQVVTHRLHHSRNQIKYPQDAPWQKLSILLDEPCHTTICHYISSFDKISIKSSKNSDLLATLVKFSQASNSHPPRQQKFVKNERSIYTT